MVAPHARSASANITLDAIEAKATALAQNIQSFDPGLRIVYAIHRTGQLKTSLQMLEDSFSDHPAGRIAATIASREFPAHEPSAFHGLCAKRQTRLAGMGGDAYLGIISINIDEFSQFTDLLFKLYRKTWMALELTAFFRGQPNEKIPDRPLNVKRNPLGEARVNLRADLFAVFMMNQEGYDSFIPGFIKDRSIDVLTQNLGIYPERLAFPMIAQTVQYALSDIIPELSPKKAALSRCSELATELAATVDDSQLKLWIRFAEMCQDMAWRGYRPETILGCAVHTSDDAFLRAVAYKVSDFSGIAPQSMAQIRLYYNSFIGVQDNYPVHAAIIEQSFETALAQALDTHNAEPFFQMMRAQNHGMTQGRFIGWCGAALHGAGRVFQNADTTGISPAQAARIEFESRCYLTPLPAFYKFSLSVIDDLRQGIAMTPERMVEIARDHGNVEQVAESFEYIAYHKNDQPPPPPVHKAEEDLIFEHIDPDKISEKISQFTRLSEPQSAAPAPKDKGSELALEED